MSDALVLALIRQALEALMWITAPLLGVAILIGIIVSLIQTVTSIQDQTFSFAPRLVAIFLVLLLIFPWALRILVTLTTGLFQDFTRYIR